MLETLAELAERDATADMIDSTVVRAHHCAVGIKRGLSKQRGLAGRAAALRPGSTQGAMPEASPARLRADTRQAHDVQGFAPLFRMMTDCIEAFLADRGYDADAIRQEIAAAGVEAVIPAKSNRLDPSRTTGPKTNGAISSSGCSTNSRTGAVSPPATTKPKSPTLASLPSHQSNSGYPLKPKGLF